MPYDVDSFVPGAATEYSPVAPIVPDVRPTTSTVDVPTVGVRPLLS